MYVFNIHPGAGEKSGIKRPLGKGIPLITEAKIIKKPRRKQLNNRVGLVYSELGCFNLGSSNEDSPEFGVRLSSVSAFEVISSIGGKLLAGKSASACPPILTKYKVATAIALPETFSSLRLSHFSMMPTKTTSFHIFE